MGTVVRLDGPGAVSLAEEPDPPLPATGVRLRTLFSGISAGTELTQYRGTDPHLAKTWDPATRLFLPGPSTVEYPAVVGYEEVGEVVEVGGATPVGRDALAIADELFLAAVTRHDPSLLVCDYHDALRTQELCCRVRELAKREPHR